MNVAPRMARLGTESAFEVLARARQLERTGCEIVHLESGGPDFDTPAHIKEAAKQALDAGATHYGPAAGLPELREAIAKHVGETRGIAVSPEEVVVTPGAKPIMFFTIMALIGDGDEVILPNPGFPIYESVINFVGGVPVPIPLREESGFGFDLALFERRVSPKTKLIVLNSPENPTGGVLDRAQLERIAAIAAARNIPVLTDEIYRQFLYEGEFVSITNLPGMQGRTILLDGFSKSYAMTGWRLGYGVMPVPLAEHVARLMVNSNSCMASFVQLAGIAALQGDQTAVAGRGRRASLERGRRGRAVRGGVRRSRRGLPPVFLCELGGQPEQGARSHAPGVRELREKVTGRTTVADVVVDGLRRAGTPYLVGLAHGGADLSVLAAARAIGMPIVLASTVRGACVMAAVAGDLADAPGAAAIGDAPDALPSALERGPMVLITSGHPLAVSGCKETLGVEPGS